jgi:hypothetical protein
MGVQMVSGAARCGRLPVTQEPKGQTGSIPVGTAMGWHVPRLAMLPCKEREVDSISTRSTNARRSLTLKRLASNQETGLNSHGAL